MRWDWHQRRFKSRPPWKGLAPPRRSRISAEQELDQLEAEVRAAYRDIWEKLPFALPVLMPGVILIVMTVIMFWSIKI